MQRVVVVGGGAMGCLFTSLLSTSNYIQQLSVFSTSRTSGASYISRTSRTPQENCERNKDFPLQQQSQRMQFTITLHQDILTQLYKYNNPILSSGRFDEHSQRLSVDVPLFSNVDAYHSFYNTDMESTNTTATTNFILLTVKGIPALQKSINLIKDLLSEHEDNNKKAAKNIIVPCMNGIAHLDLLQREFPKSPIVFCTTAMGAYWQNLSNLTSSTSTSTMEHLIHAGNGSTTICNAITDTEVAKEVLQLFKSSHINCSLYENGNAASLLWSKLIANCVINPLTAILRVKNGRLLEPDAWKQLSNTIEKIVEECIVISIVAEVSHFVWEELTTSSTTDLKTRVAHGIAYIKQVMKATANNYSSTCSDILAQRPTEIASFNGMVSKYGKQYNIPTPVNDAMMALVTMMEPNNANSMHVP